LRRGSAAASRRQRAANAACCIEVRGIDKPPALIGRACAAALKLLDPAIGATFDLARAVIGLAPAVHIRSCAELAQRPAF
jgi:hypothetical protein